MAEKTRKVVIEVEISAEDPDEDGYIHLRAGKVSVKGKNLTSEQLSRLAESWGQSDWFYVDFTADILSCM